MGCSSCSTGKPGGCKSNGGCSTGGCNRLNVHDWLANLPFSDPDSDCRIVEVTFNNGSRKEFYRNNTLQPFMKGDMVTVEGVSGFDVGMVNLSGELVRLQMKKKGVKEDNPEIKKIMRKANDMDLQKWRESKEREKPSLVRARAIIIQLKLDMKLIEVEFQADGRKATFYYTAEDRVDFRELIKIYASEFKIKVEMKQIGIRQEAAKIGGIGSCGRELCCSSWLSDFKSVTTTIARYQNLTINQTKLSGQCGRLKCCLNYELDTYLDALQQFPNNADTLELTRGTAQLIKKDIFKNLMWYILPDSNKQYPVPIDRVKEIRAMNARGQRPDELGAIELSPAKAEEKEHAHVELVGQISLRTLERNSKKRRDKEKAQQQKQQPQRPGGSQGQGQRQGGQQQQNRPPQQQRQGGQQPGGKPQGGQGQQQRPPQQNRPQQQQRPGGQQQPKQGGGNQQQRPPQQNRPQIEKKKDQPPQNDNA
ncbi:cell fate regulator YaaT (PSP1 superfamily) [Lacibacter cauensis]|uniref:Cell fate regulator YaaT (PSP1 superfamily) n=1 Tax=Lacibacter cauensis TaxID=510947 RepID=A0A562SKF1_9BACT|nr:regulatory iron-sulfur-containing complex subunit RicT [Lacibacter cauensis]TWI81474.1 cell fate regulator YaaT (PSP1 superfamily) [Lacibacter cauensis]